MNCLPMTITTHLAPECREFEIGKLEIGEFQWTVRSSREEFEPKKNKALERESREIDIQQMAGKCL